MVGTMNQVPSYTNVNAWDIGQEYVCGFAIDRTAKWVLLIQKNRPAFQVGKWNGIGGKVEPGESPIDAMVREFREECGIETEPADWTNTIIMDGRGDEARPEKTTNFRVHYFRMFADLVQMPFMSMTDEKVSAIGYQSGLWDRNTLDNMKWIFPLQLNENLVFPVRTVWQR